MRIRWEFLLIFFALPVFTAAGQEGYFRPGFARAVMINPAFSGAEGNTTIRMSYINLLPSISRGLHSAEISCDFYSEFLHGGAGFFAANDFDGEIINKTGAGISYAYHLKAGRDLYINAGLGAFVRHTGINRDRVVLPDQIDPVAGNVLPSGDIISYGGRTYFDIGTGFLAGYRNYSVAVSVNHLAKPDAEGGGTPEGQLKRRLTLFTWADYYLDRNRKYKISPLFFSDFSGKEYLVSGYAVFSAGKVAVNTGASTNRAGDINMNGGVAFRILNTLLFYNYCFNLRSHNNMLPLTISHEGGISLSLNNVNKRNTVRTINFPEL